MESHNQADNGSRTSSISRLDRDLTNSPHSPFPGSVSSSERRMLQRVLPPGCVPHVCVVGAGMAGLRCAEVLIRNGIKVTILEGRDRIGGRIHQSSHLGHLVDEGPNWIHGTESNPILDLARASQSDLHSWGERQNVFDQNGKLFPPDKATEHSDFLWSTIVDAFKFSNKESGSISPKESLLDFFRKRLRERSESTESNKLNLNGAETETEGSSDEQLLWMAEMWGAFIGDPIDRQSLKFFWLEECIDGENLFVASTYKKILDKVAEIALAKADLQFSKKVISIEGLAAQNADDQVSVATADGKVQKFDEVVVTAPLGWLKQNKEAFSPPLEARLSQAIDAISYGRLEKVYLTFPIAFWENPGVNTGDVQKEPLDEKASTDHAIGFSHWMHPTYASSSNPQCWNQEAVNLAALPSSNAHPTLLFYIYGPCSSHLTSQLSSLPSSEHHETLSAFFRPYYSRLPHYISSSSDCSPLASQATSWATDDLAGYGSYCNFQVGLEDADGDIEAMRTGIPEKGIWLAGEHTAPFIALGTTTGAYWSGEGVAQRIIEAYGESRCDEETYRKIKDKRENILNKEQKIMNGTGN
ncbi:MAG: hypothetical protein M1837_006738 [Sclerophora amabilis]|nr:MAG: hypothetical protein M1837_006738 [Sclerophora amabilis]